MTNRELTAYLLVAAMAFAVLVGWRIAASRRRRHRRSGHSRIDLMEPGSFRGKAAEGKETEGQVDANLPP